MDTPVTESTGALDTSQAATLFAQMFDDSEPRKEEEQSAAENDEPSPVEAEGDESEPETEADDSQPETITIKIDGKDVEVTLDELKKGYQRQADYTRKTMEVAEQRKAVEAEFQKVAQERSDYAQKLNEQALLMNAVMQEQQKIDWQQLLENDPVEYLKQQHLYQQRQAGLQQIQQEQMRVMELQQAEAQKYQAAILEDQRSRMLESIPEWKDAEKAKAEVSELREYLEKSGVTKQELDSLNDHRHVVIARKAMLYDKMMAKAQATAKKVENLPKKVERPGVGKAPSLDKRTQSFQRLSKTGRVEDAAAVFSSLL